MMFYPFACSLQRAENDRELRVIEQQHHHQDYLLVVLVFRHRKCQGIAELHCNWVFAGLMSYQEDAARAQKQTLMIHEISRLEQTLTPSSVLTRAIGTLAQCINSWQKDHYDDLRLEWLLANEKLMIFERKWVQWSQAANVSKLSRGRLKKKYRTLISTVLTIWSKIRQQFEVFSTVPNTHTKRH